MFSSGAGSRICSYQLGNDGIARFRQGIAGGAYTNIPGEWLVAGAAADVEVMASGLTGSTPSGTFGSWLNLATTRTWELTAINSSCSFTVQLRPAGGGAVLDTITVSMENESV